jgi:transcriptional regulator with XRE-family HTH domain
VCQSTKESLTFDDEAEQRTTLIAFGRRLNATREAAEVSQSTLEARCFLADGAVSKLERGCRPVPGLILILRLAAGLMVDPGILLDGLPVPQRTGGIGQAVVMIAESPGIRTAPLAEKMGLPNSYVLRLIRWLSGYGVISHYQGGWAVVQVNPARVAAGT